MIMPEESKIPTAENSFSKRKYKAILLFGLFIIILIAVSLFFYSKQQNKFSKQTPSSSTSNQTKNPNLDIDLTETNREWVLLFSDPSGPFEAYDFEGNKTASLEAGGNVVILLSPDRKKVIYTAADNNVWYHNLSTNKETRITDSGKFRSKTYKGVVVVPIVWAPDSQQLLYKVFAEDKNWTGIEDSSAINPSVNYGLYIFNLKTQGNKFLTSSANENYFWPNGFNNPLFKRAGESELYELDLDSAGINKIVQLPYTENVATNSFYKDEKIVWVSKLSPNIKTQIVMSNLDGSDKVLVTSKSDWRYQSVLFSPNGRYGLC